MNNKNIYDIATALRRDPKLFFDKIEHHNKTSNSVIAIRNNCVGSDTIAKCLMVAVFLDITYNQAYNLYLQYKRYKKTSV